jgi:beta-ureidopropionase
MEAHNKQTFYDVIKKKLSPEELKVFNRIHYGQEEVCELTLKDLTVATCKEADVNVAGYCFSAATEEERKPKIVRVGLIQHSIVLSTDKPVVEQRNAIFDKINKIIDAAATERVQILCLQETWPMPFFLCTGEKEKWSEFAENAIEGPTTKFLSTLAKKHNMVIVSPILENDNGTWWNTAVVINENGEYMGKHRKNHLPSLGSYSELSYYAPGNLGHPVFDTKYGKIAINICYGRHQALNWLMFGINGAEIVFNPAATISEFGESFWRIEARNAAIANSYFTCGINRVGTETFQVIKEDKEDTVTRNYYGSSYVSAPNGCRTPCLSKSNDGLLICELDLNLCRQVKDEFGFNLTSRLDLYARELNTKINK